MKQDPDVLALQAMERSLKAEIHYLELSEIEERIIDANCNMLSRIIDYCKKNSIPFDNGLIVLLHEARKVLSPDFEHSIHHPKDEQNRSAPPRNAAMKHTAQCTVCRCVSREP